MTLQMHNVWIKSENVWLMEWSSISLAETKEDVKQIGWVIPELLI
jgi:hypothetical protein